MNSPRVRPSGALRPSLLVVLLALAAPLAAQWHLPLALRAPLGFLLLGVLPGWVLTRFLLRAEGTTAEERAMGSLALSVPLAIAARTLAFALGLSPTQFLWGWAALCAVGALAVRPRRHAGPPADPVAWTIALGLALLVALPAAFNTVARQSGDSMFHAQIVSEIRLRGIPPQDPSYAGLALNYVWQLHVWAAALVEAMGLTAYQVFPWIGGAMMAAMSFGVYRLAGVLWPERLHRRLAPLVVALGMNALGWVQPVARLLVSPFAGSEHGMGHFQRLFSQLVVHPYGFHVCGALVFQSYFVLCSWLYKYFCANALGTALTMVVLSVVMVAVRLREGGNGRLVAIALLTLSAAAIHPVVGVPAGLALVAGTLLAIAGRERRAHAIAAGLAVVSGLALAAPVLWSMLHTGLQHGPPTRLHLVKENLLPLAQGLLVVALPALWGWFAAWRRAPAPALLGLGFAAGTLAFALLFDTPVPLTACYLVYIAYLGVALFAAAGVGLAVTALSRRIGAPLAWALAALVFLPNALLMANGFAREGTEHGLAGYPETRDEIALFDYLRDRTPVEAVAVDVQPAYSSAVAGYAERRGFFGGGDPTEAAMMGYPRDVLAERRSAVVDLLLEPGLRASTLRTLGGVRPPLFVVARRTPPPNLIVVPPPPRPIDAVAKLDSLPERFVPVMRTPTLALYRFVREAAADPR